MKIIIFMCFLFFSCYLPTDIEQRCNEKLIYATWSAYIITSNGQQFKTSFGVRGINIPVIIVNHNNKWYIWTKHSGYGDEIFPIGEGKCTQ